MSVVPRPHSLRAELAVTAFVVFAVLFWKAYVTLAVVTSLVVGPLLVPPVATRLAAARRHRAAADR